MRYIIILCAILAVVAAPVRAEDATVGTVDNLKGKAILSSVVVAAGATSALSDAWSVPWSTYQGLQVTISSSASPPSLAILVSGSADRTTYGVPTTGETVTTLTADGTYIVALTLPLVQDLKIRAANGSATVNTTVTVYGVAK